MRRLDDLARRFRTRRTPADQTPARPLPWTTQAMRAKVDLDDPDAVADAVADGPAEASEPT